MKSASELFTKKILILFWKKNYSFCFEKNLSFGYVNSGNTIETLKNKNLFIEVEKTKYAVEILLKPLNTKDYKNI